MSDRDPSATPSTRRSRIGWWLFVGGLAAAVAFVAAHFVGLLVFGVFGYYATRPICSRIGRVVDSNRLAGATTVLLILAPIALLLVYAAVRIGGRMVRLSKGTSVESLVGQFVPRRVLSVVRGEHLGALVGGQTSTLDDLGGVVLSSTEMAMQVVQAVFGTVLFVGLALALSYVLLVRDRTFADAFVELVGGRDTTAYAYAAAVDEDLESVFFGNLLFATAMAVVASAAYWTTNALAPAGIRVPMVFVLGVLTGIASLVPIVVGKIVYVPVVAYLGLQAVRTGDGGLPFVGLVLLAYLVVLDLGPQALLQPYVSGRQFDMAVLLFAYVLGPIVFGWYGFFLLPILFVLLFEAVRIALPELLRGEPPRPAVELDTDSGTNPRSERDDVPGSE